MELATSTVCCLDCTYTCRQQLQKETKTETSSVRDWDKLDTYAPWPYQLCKLLRCQFNILQSTFIQWIRIKDSLAYNTGHTSHPHTTCIVQHPICAKYLIYIRFAHVKLINESERHCTAHSGRTMKSICGWENSNISNSMARVCMDMPLFKCKQASKTIEVNCCMAVSWSNFRRVTITICAFTRNLLHFHPHACTCVSVNVLHLLYSFGHG